MNTSEKIYNFLSVLFCCLIVLGNLTYQKFVTLEIPLIYKFELSVGAILYPLTFMFTDLITEFYSKEKATFCVRMTLVINIIVAVILFAMDYLPATSWSKINDYTFHQVFGFYSLALFGSLVACYISQAIDINLYLIIRRITNGKHLWLRNNLSTAISLFIDTIIVISILTIFKVLPMAEYKSLIINSYSWKLFFTIAATPLFYLLVKIIKSIS